MNDYVVSATLGLKDNFSSALSVFKSELKDSDNKYRSFKNSLSTGFGMKGGLIADMAIGATKAVIGLGVAVAGVGLTIGTLGVKSAFSMEKYRAVLETVLKDSEKAGDTLEWASKYSDVSNFSTEQAVEATTKLHAYGIEAKNVLPTIGDMATAMGKDLIQAVEAVADAQTGEMERMKEFGIKKDTVVQYGKKLGMSDFVDAKGTITDTNKFMEVMMMLIREKYAGANEKAMDSFGAVVNAIKGTAMDSILQVLGMNKRGETEAGSFLDYLKQNLIKVRDWMIELRDNGTFSAWAKQVGEFSRVAFEKLGEFFLWIGEQQNNGNMEMFLETMKTSFTAVYYLVKGTFEFLKGTLQILVAIADVLTAGNFSKILEDNRQEILRVRELESQLFKNKGGGFAGISDNTSNAVSFTTGSKPVTELFPTASNNNQSVNSSIVVNIGEVKTNDPQNFVSNVVPVSGLIGIDPSKLKTAVAKTGGS